jgi:adhesin transport system outer membrane protein
MIYDFGKVSSQVNEADAIVKREQANVLKQLQVIEQRAAEAVINTHRYQVLVDLAEQQVQAVKRTYEMAKLRADAGASTRSDPIQAETRVQSAQANLIQIKALEELARQRLRTLVGGPVTGEIAPLPNDRAASVKLQALPATDRMPEVLVAQAQELVARARLDGAKAQQMPTLSLNYSATKNIRGQNAVTLVERGSNRSLLLSVDWTAFQGGALVAQTRAAEHALDVAHLNVETARVEGSDVARSYRELVLGAYDRLGKLRDRKGSIAQVRDLYREQYKLGTRSILDLLNAEQEYYQAVSDEEGAMHDYWIALVEYIGAVGEGNSFYGIASHVAALGVEIR